MKHLSRRLFLKGVGGVTVGLPLLESLRPREAWSQALTAPKRLVIFFQCNGVNMGSFFPVTPYGPLSAASFAGTALQPLSAYAQRLLIPRGIHKVPKGFNLDGQTPVGDDHHNGMGGKLTAQALSGSDMYANGISVDQELAKKVNPAGRSSLTLKVGPRGSGVLSVISYTASRMPVQGENNPWFAFRDFMGLGTPPPPTTPPPPPPAVMDAGVSMPPPTTPPPPGPSQTELRMLQRRQSVLDLVRTGMDTLRSKRLSKGDREKLDLHFSSIRDVEQQMVDAGLPQMPSGTDAGMGGGGMAMGPPDAGTGSTPMTPGFQPPQCNLPAARTTELSGLNPNAVGSDAEYKRMGQMQMDVMAIALACDRTRVASLQWGNGAGGPIFNWDGMTNQYNHHKLSHGNTRDDNSGSAITDYLDRLFAIDTWHAQQFAYLLGKLDGYGEGAGSLLDNSVTVWVNELSQGRAHDFRDLPFVIAGGAGYFKQGEYVKVTSQSNTLNSADASHNKLLAMFLNACGARQADGSPYTTFGPYGTPGEFAQLKR